jgi:hypothetical protein
MELLLLLYIYYCFTVTVLFLWDALSDERTDLYFVYAAGTCQRSLSGVLVRWDSRPCFTVSDLRLPFSSPPTARGVTVEVFDPASKSKSKSKLHCDWRSISKSWCRAPSVAHDQIFITVWQLRSWYCGALSLTRGRVSLLSESLSAVVSHCHTVKDIYIVHIKHVNKCI